MHKVECIFRLEAPLFLSGANQAAAAELRAASIKGALRFWWRTIAFRRFQREIRALRSAEASIFGGTQDDTQQSSFSLHISESLDRQDWPQRTKPGFGPGSIYLGFGLIKYNGELERPCIAPGLRFTLRLVSRDPIDTSLIEAIELLGLLGGLGSRSRRGYGSLNLVSLEVDGEVREVPTAQKSYIERLTELLNESTSIAALPPYSAFSAHTRLDLLGIWPSWHEALNSVGEQMQRYRSWGRGGMVNNRPSEKRFDEDHTWSKRPDLWSSAHPERVAFGLPHNYGQGLRVEAEGYNRRGSPLLLHVHALEEGYTVSATLLGADFLPPKTQIAIKHKREHDRLVENKADLSILHKFLDGRIRSENGKEGDRYFPNSVCILKGRPETPR